MNFGLKTHILPKIEKISEDKQTDRLSAGNNLSATTKKWEVEEATR